MKIPEPPAGDEKVPLVQFSVQVPEALADELKREAKRRGISRNALALHFLSWAWTEYKRERGVK